MNAETADAFTDALNRDLVATLSRSNRKAADSLSVITVAQLKEAFSRYKSDGENHD